MWELFCGVCGWFGVLLGCMLLFAIVGGIWNKISNHQVEGFVNRSVAIETKYRHQLANDVFKEMTDLTNRVSKLEAKKKKGK